MKVESSFKAYRDRKKLKKQLVLCTLLHTNKKTCDENFALLLYLSQYQLMIQVYQFILCFVHHVSLLKWLGLLLTGIIKN